MTVTRDMLGDTSGRISLETTPLVARLAVLGSFDPSRIDDPAIAEVLRSCAVRLHRDDEHQEWMLTESVRVQALAHRLRGGGLAALTALQRDAPVHFDNAVQAKLRAWLADEPPPSLSACSEDELAAWMHVARWSRPGCRRRCTPGRNRMPSRASSPCSRSPGRCAGWYAIPCSAATASSTR